MNTSMNLQGQWERSTTRRLLSWLFSWAGVRIFLIAIACLVTPVALFYAVENWRGTRAWNKYRNEREAQGERFDIQALIPPPVPDDQNFAMCPLLKPLLDIIPDSKPRQWRNPQAKERVSSISQAKSATTGTDRATAT